MNQSGAMKISIAVHAAVLTLVIGISRVAIPEDRIISIDFTVGDPFGAESPGAPGSKAEGLPPGKKGTQAAKKDEAEAKPGPVSTSSADEDKEIDSKKEPDRVEKLEEKKWPENDSVPAEAADTQVSLPPVASHDVNSVTSDQGGESNTGGEATTPDRRNGTNGQGTGSVTGNGAGGPGGSGEWGRGGTGTGTGKKNGISRADFSYIRDLLLKNLLYPEDARRTGMSGKVILSFIIDEKGYVTDIKILKSSGCRILDDNAVDTVRKVSPFHGFSVKAELKIPVVYKLE